MYFFNAHAHIQNIIQYFVGHYLLQNKNIISHFQFAWLMIYSYPRFYNIAQHIANPAFPVSERNIYSGSNGVLRKSSVIHQKIIVLKCSRMADYSKNIVQRISIRIFNFYFHLITCFPLMFRESRCFFGYGRLPARQ